ncbi:pectinesterase inhibitor 12-like [Chenopodium quinoa]|uniref:pectinesterase inhibitor 12-like n=1 Tax=Chenopodium quinoa TaxID=63459 RepID=UPI000B7925A7|nr:pectinesterase inhibitor 12-like [Chenopodium quinoa]
MHSNRPFSKLPVFFFLTIIFTILSLINAANVISDSCEKIIHYDANVKYPVCVKVLESDQKSANTTVAQLGTIAFQMAISNTTSILSKIDTIVNDPKTDPSTKEGLKACTEIYTDANKNLQDGLTALTSGDYFTASNKASAAQNDPAACQNKFAQSPLTKENGYFFQLSSIALGFADLLKATN